MMKRKISVFLLLCVATFLQEVATAQSLSIFAKQKVVIWDIFDRNDQPLDEGFKRLIYQKIMDDCTNSRRYAVYNECVEDAKRQLKAKGLPPNFPNICKMIGQKADFIIFTEVEASQSAIGSQDVTIHISMSLYRIQTASKVLPAHENAAASVQSVMSAISRAMAKLGVSNTAQRQSSQQPSYQQPSYQQPAQTQPAQTASQQSVQSQSSQNTYNSTSTITSTTVESIEEWRNKGVELYFKKSYTAAFPYLKRAAEHGSTSAQYYLGACYRWGRGVTQDYCEAVKWYRKAAEKNNKLAQYSLGSCYRFGRGVPKDHAQAVRWYQRAAENGHKYAKKALAEMRKS